MMNILEEKISIDELMNGYSSRKSEDAKSRYLSAKVKTVDYMPFEEACVIADMIIANSVFDSNQNIKVDSCKKYLLYIYSLIYYYTNVDIHENSWVKEFNELNKQNMIEPIISLIPEKIIGEFDAILKMKTDDAMTNYYNIQSYIDKKIVDFLPMFAKTMSTSLQRIETVLDDISKNPTIKDNIFHFLSALNS